LSQDVSQPFLFFEVPLLLLAKHTANIQAKNHVVIEFALQDDGEHLMWECFSKARVDLNDLAKVRQHFELTPARAFEIKRYDLPPSVHQLSISLSIIPSSLERNGMRLWSALHTVSLQSG
jgi:hypothetical protein